MSGLVVLLLLLQVTSLSCLEDAPTGHHQPLGGHRPPDVHIDDTDTPPDPRTFWEKYVKPGKPLIVREALKHSPAFNLWTTEYLKENYGDLEVRLEGKLDKEYGIKIPIGAKGMGRDTIGNFIDTYQHTNKYIVSQLPEPMYKEVKALPSMQCGTLKKSMVEIDLWMSSGNSRSVLHKDAFNTWNCLLSGTKNWKMVENKYEKLIYKAWESERQIGGYSTINATKVDLLNQPMVRYVRWANLTINAGDCLFLPASYYHQVNSVGDPNIAVAMLFSRLFEFDDTGCDEAELKYTPLNEMEITWNWLGHGNMTMGHTDHTGLRFNLLRTVRHYGKFKLKDMLREMTLFDPAVKADKGIKWFDILDVKHKGFLTEEDVEELDIGTLRKFILTVEEVDPSNVDGLAEYYFIPEGHIELLVNALMRETDTVQERNLLTITWRKWAAVTSKEKRYLTISAKARTTLPPMTSKET
ncbi:bifunctional peptidase and arginyl-hydroxylase JMJD5-like [Ptychodera flava]|uniref:bifunctional peptidase and arginyl-hydroxylase JMJD5-like n=1 Tax=Ptychodera flava TaxID=63121 RepID=UPI003969F0D5